MLINCAAYQDGRKLADIDIDAISDYVSKPECFVWVALKDPTPDEIDLMGEEFALHELALEDARKASTPENRGVRRFAVRGAAYGRAR